MARRTKSKAKGGPTEADSATKGQASHDATFSTTVPLAATTGSSTTRWATILAVGMIASAAIVVYCNSFSGTFMFDDPTWIAKNRGIHHLWPLTDVLFPANGEVVGGRPVVSLTLAINYALSGLDVCGYHAVNLAIHILAALTLFGVARRTLLLPAVGDRFGSTAIPLAFATTLIWTVHPLQTEAVTYVIQRLRRW